MSKVYDDLSGYRGNLVAGLYQSFGIAYYEIKFKLSVDALKQKLGIRSQEEEGHAMRDIRILSETTLEISLGTDLMHWLL